MAHMKLLQEELKHHYWKSRMKFASCSALAAGAGRSPKHRNLEAVAVAVKPLGRLDAMLYSPDELSLCRLSRLQ